MLKFKVKNESQKPENHPDLGNNLNYAKKWLSCKWPPCVSVRISKNVLYFSFTAPSGMPMGNYSTPISLQLPWDAFSQCCEQAYAAICEKAEKATKIYKND